MEKVFKGNFFWLFLFLRHSTLLHHMPPLRFHCVAQDAGIETRTVATLALTTRLDLIHMEVEKVNQL